MRALPKEIFIRARRGDGTQLQEFILPNASFDLVREAIPEFGRGLQTSLSRRLVRPRDVMTTVSIERSLDSGRIGFEYIWTRGTHLLGSNRMLRNDDWADLIESSRSLTRHQLHGRFEHHGNRHSITAQLLPCGPRNIPSHGPGFGVRAGIVDCGFVMQRVLVWTRDSFDHVEQIGVAYTAYPPSRARKKPRHSPGLFPCEDGLMPLSNSRNQSARSA